MKVLNALGQLQVTRYNDVVDRAKRSIFLSLAGGWPSLTTPDSGFIVLQTSSNKVCIKGTLFPALSSDTNHEFGFVMPLNWDGGTITGKPYFRTASPTADGSTIIFGLQGISYGSGDTLDAAWGTAQDSLLAVVVSTNGLMTIGPETSPITLAGTPAGGEYVQMRTYRKGADTFATDVWLLGWLLKYGTTNYSDE